MGAPKTQTVGGGSASPVANSWNQFLQGQLYQQPGAQAIPQTAAGGAQPQANIPNWVPNGLRGQLQTQMQAQQPQQQNPGAFQDTLNSFMNPNYGNMIANNPFLAGAQGYNPMAQMPQAQMGGMGGKGGFGGMQGGMNIPSATGGFTPSNAATIDPNSFVNSFGSGPDLLAQYGIDLSKFMGGGAVSGGGMPGGVGGGFTPGQLKDYSGDPSFQAIQQIAERQRMGDVANLRARYGMGGNTQSSGASLAESQYLAEANPRLIAGLGSLGRDIQGLDLQQQQINNAGRASMAGASSGGAASMSADASRNLGNILQFIQGMQGQQLGAGTQLAGQNLSNQQGTNNLNSNNMLQALGMDQNTMMNLFGQQSSNALNNQGMANNWMQTLFGGGLNLQGMGQQGQQNMLQNLFNSFNQSNQIGNPQAQTVQTPNPWMQGLGMAATFAPMLMGMPPMPGAGSAISGMGMSRPMAPPQMSGQLSPNFQPNFGIGQQPPFNYRSG